MTRAHVTCAAWALVALSVAVPVGAQEFSYLPPGDLVTGSGQGQVDDTIFAPYMLFPMADLPAFANSQVYGNGGYLGPGGGQCDAPNYSYPWRDNYCEIRQWDMPLCPAGTGHQGQDIRAATCDKNVHAVVAAVDGAITNIGSYSVYLTADDGTRYDYLHMGNVQVSPGQEVKRGDVLGYVSNEFGGTATTIHLHFNIRQFVDGIGTVYVPPYTSLINSYQSLFAPPPATGALEGVGCDLITGWAADLAAPADPVTVLLVFDASGAGHDVVADAYRDDLCENLGNCDHGLSVPSPLSLFDGAAHSVDASVVDASVAQTQLPGSPLTLECEPPELAGAKRAVADTAAWNLSPFWDQPPIDTSEVDALPVGAAMGAAPILWLTPDGLFVHDDGTLRPVDEASARAWRFDVAAAESHDGDEGLTIGDDWPARPILLRDGSSDAYLLDGDAASGPPGFGVGGDDAGGAASDEASCGCRTPGEPRRSHAWAMLLGLLALAWRRRASRR